MISQLLQELPDLGLLCLKKHQKAPLWGKGLKVDVIHNNNRGLLWLSGRVLDSRSICCGFEPYQRHCIVSLNKTGYPLHSTGSTREDLSRHGRKIVD